MQHQAQVAVLTEESLAPRLLGGGGTRGLRRPATLIGR